jgi:hypothetical protein
MGIRALKKEVLCLLSTGDFRKNLDTFRNLPARQTVNPLFTFFYHTDDIIRWHAISAMGLVVSGLADNDMESARVVMRRLIWNLNDESGGIGWGSPEAMGEIMARHRQLADEFAKLLRSYIMPHGNFLEHEALQRGVLWGLARLARNRPGHVAAAGPFLCPFLKSKDPVHRGLSALIMGAVLYRASIKDLEGMIDDPADVEVYENLKFKTVTVGRLAADALSKLMNTGP